MDTFFRFIKKIIPNSLFVKLQPLYHYALAYLGAVRYKFPSRKLFVIAVTGTKGKTSTTEVINAILEENGFKTALTNTIRFKIGEESEKNLYKMSMPGRFFMQNFLYRALTAGCTHVILEMTSEGAKQFRHLFIDLDVLLFTNISPEHIESHGSFENYLAAKLQIAKSLEQSKKENTLMIANRDDKYGEQFLETKADKQVSFSLRDVRIEQTNPLVFNYRGKDFHSELSGIFNAHNILGSITLAEELDIDMETVQNALNKVTLIPGRVEYIHGGQPFDVIVDYAHTKESLESLYKLFAIQKSICVLGNTGGGRDVWKRPLMAKVAEENCDKIILTNEDPYDEDPEKIINEMADAMNEKPEIIIDRREAIAKALTYADKDSVVLITGKGTDPYLMEENGKKTPWSDKLVAEEEIELFLLNKNTII